MDCILIKQRAEYYLPQMSSFLRELIKIGGESRQEQAKAIAIQKKMEELGFSKAYIDPMGNVLGYMGEGERIIAYDAHIDTVGVGEIKNWSFDPYDGFEDENRIGGRGSCDQLGGIVCSLYGARIMKELSLIPECFSILVTGTVQEEDCDGLCWQYIINESKIRPEFVVITEPTDGNIYRGQRGRMEICVQVKGISCHGSAPERGENAIYKMSDIIKELEALNSRLSYDEFLGKGTLAVTQIYFSGPSRCAVADGCAISIDRRLTAGETQNSAIDEIKALPSVKKYDAEVFMYDYDEKSYTGLSYPIECYFPTWVTDKESPALLALVESFGKLYGEPTVDKWTFSTNGVSIAGRNGITCVGLGPGKENQAHAPNETIDKKDLVLCAAVYAALPSLYAAGEA